MTSLNGKLYLMLLLLLTVACGKNVDPAGGNDLYRFSVENQLDIPVSDAAVTVGLSQFDLPPGHCRYVLHLVGADYAQGAGETTYQDRTSQQAANGSADGSDSNVQEIRQEISHDIRREIPSQCDDLTGDGIPDELFFLADFGAGQTLHFELTVAAERPQYQQRTQAFLKVQTGGRFEDGLYIDGAGMEKTGNIDIPNEQVQGSGWAHMEGPVWESDLVGYRFYLDARNRVDIFSKSMPDMVLDTVSQNYHQILPWGTDVLKVGNSLGLGSLAAVKDGDVRTIDNWTSRRFEVPVDGPLRSIIRMTYHGWEVFGHSVSVVSEIEIHAGNRYTEQRVSLAGHTDGLTLATGIVKHPDAEKLYTGDAYNSTYGWTSGKQADQGHGLDMAIIIPMAYQPEHRVNDPDTHLFAFSVVDGNAVYSYTSAWELDHDVVPDFHAHVQATAALLTNPPKVRFVH
jgi:hypothetical protein